MKNIIDIISNGEGLTIEFKKSREKVTSDDRASDRASKKKP